jgi:hypothetical protein
MPRRRQLSPEERAVRTQAIDLMYRSGCSTVDICDFLDISQGTVVTSLNAANTPRRARGRPRHNSPDRPQPIDVMGQDWEPGFMNPDELAVFKNRISHLVARPYEPYIPEQPRLPYEYDLPHTLWRPLETEVQLGMGELAVDASASEEAPEVSPSELVSSRLSELVDPADGKLIEDDSSKNEPDEMDELIAY